MTAEEFLNEKEGYISSREETWPIRRWDIELLQEFARLKCKEQRQLCADNADADYNFVGNRDENSHIEVYVIKGSILNCPEPEM